MNHPSQVVLLLLATITACSSAGCGGVTRETTRSDSALGLGAAQIRSSVKVEGVVNATGNPSNDAVCLFLHIKTAQWLEEHGYSIVEDGVLAESDLPFLHSLSTQAADQRVSIVLESIDERAGATISLGLISSQRQTAAAVVRADWSGRIAQGAGRSTKGAWGALAKVRRETLLKRQGFWAFDESVVGAAAGVAVQQALARVAQ